ncbi:hypothetical protein CLV53_105171, partial [Sediminibacterium magnilacihabitans]
QPRMGVNSEDIETDGKWKDFLPGFNSSADVKRDMIITSKTF